MATVYIGIGSNEGDRRANLRRSVELLAGRGISVLSVSRVIETEPWGEEDQPKFLNMAVWGNTVLTPREVLAVVKRIELDMGRDFSARRWGPRVIDLDILLYDDLVMETEDLSIPHALMHERDFVIQPLAEIAAEVIHPVLGKRIDELLQSLPGR